MEITFNNPNNTFKKNDTVIVMQEIDELPRVISYGIISYVKEEIAVVTVDNDNFVISLPFYIVKTSEMIKVSIYD